MGSRQIEHQEPEHSTDCQDTDVVMDESLVQRALSTQRSTSLVDLILSLPKFKYTWKPNVQNVMQQFQDFDSERYDIKNCHFDIVQNSKLRFNQCKEVSLFGQRFTEAPSASNWTNRSIKNYDALELPKTFEELNQIPMDRPYNSLDTSSIEKEIAGLGIEAQMFWEIPKVRAALNELCKKIPSTYQKTLQPRYF